MLSRTVVHEFRGPVRILNGYFRLHSIVKMWPIAADVLTFCVVRLWPWALQSRLNRSRCRLGAIDSGGRKEPCVCPDTHREGAVFEETYMYMRHPYSRRMGCSYRCCVVCLQCFRLAGVTSKFVPAMRPVLKLLWTVLLDNFVHHCPPLHSQNGIAERRKVTEKRSRGFFHSTWTELNWPNESTQLRRHLLVTRVSVTTGLTAAKLGRLVLGEFWTHAFHSAAVHTGVLELQFSSVHVLRTDLILYEWGPRSRGCVEHDPTFAIHKVTVT